MNAQKPDADLVDAIADRVVAKLDERRAGLNPHVAPAPSKAKLALMAMIAATTTDDRWAALPVQRPE